jgi:UrcA family protein
VPSVKVSYADLNLSTLAGADALYRRIERAARTVCGSDDMRERLGHWRAWRNCYDSAIANAVAKVNSPLLSAVHSSKTDGAKVAGLLSQSSRTK